MPRRGEVGVRFKAIRRKKELAVEYNTWQQIRLRCKPGHPNASVYFERGITVCERWDTSFDAFYSDMGPRPPGMTIERINNDGPYSPENCKWATRQEQAVNRRATRQVIVNGVRMSLSQAANHAGLAFQTVLYRVRNKGWSPEKALSTPPQNAGSRTHVAPRREL